MEWVEVRRVEGKDGVGLKLDMVVEGKDRWMEWA